MFFSAHSPNGILLEPLTQKGRHLSQNVAAGLAAFCCAVLLARWVFVWQGNLLSLTAFARMADTTALAFIASAVAIWLSVANPYGRPSLFAVLGILGLTIAGTVSWWGMDHLGEPGAYMSPATALCFVFAAGALLTIHSKRPLFGFITTAGVILSVLALTGFIFDTRALYQVALFSTMGPHTAACFLVLFLAIKLMAPHRSWIGLFFGNGPGSIAIRRLVPITVAPLVLLGLLTRNFEYEQVSDISFRLSVYAVATMSLMLAIMLLRARDSNVAHTKLLTTIENLEDAVADRDFLMKEVNHRVKNNLQQINALMSLQARRSKEEETKVAFASMQTRLSALASVHRQLIEQDTPSAINAEAFLNDLCKNLSLAFGAAERGITISCKVACDVGNLNDAVTIGLLSNELLSNALRHAFVGTDGGVIDVGLSRSGGGQLILTVADNGVGETNSDNSGGGIGSLIIKSLVQQLGATLQRHAVWSIPGSTLARRSAQDVRPGTFIQIKIPS